MPQRPKSSRRAFLAGRAAADTLAALAEPSAPLSPLAASVGVQPGSHLLSVGREAMACLFEIVFDAAQYQNRTDAAVAALDVVEALEAQLTIYRETSEVAQLNRHAASGPVAVERGLFDLLSRAAELSRATTGAFDFTTGRLSKVWGFYRRQGRMPEPEEIAAALAEVGVASLDLDSQHATVRFLKPGIELNLGAIGKGYALDRAADTMQAGGVNDFLIHGGNSSVLARGSKAAPENPSASENPPSDVPAGWSVALRHPLRPDVRLAEFILRDQALGTSGSGTQFFHYQGRRYGHILDPRTGWPADKVLSATVIAPTAELADALSTAFYVAGLEPAQAYCQSRPQVAALLCTASKTGLEVEMHAINLPDDGWRAV